MSKRVTESLAQSRFRTTAQRVGDGVIASYVHALATVSAAEPAADRVGLPTRARDGSPCRPNRPSSPTAPSPRRPVARRVLLPV
jgi:hypothetical protein